MIDIVFALQNYKDTKNMIEFWNKKVEDYIFEQDYDVQEYEELCYELQHVWPTNQEISRKNMLQDVVVKKVPYTKDNVWYAMCTYPNYWKISDNTPVYIAPTIDNVMFCKYHDCYEMAAVAFFNSKLEIRKYYRDIARVGEIVFAVMCCYFFLFKDISDINVREFKKLASIRRNSSNRSMFSNNYSWDVTVFVNKIMSNDNDLGELPDAKMCKILHDCLVTFKGSADFIGRCS